MKGREVKMQCKIAGSEIFVVDQHLTGRSSVSLRAGALLYLHSTVIAGGVRNSDVHLDVCDAV